MKNEIDEKQRDEKKARAKRSDIEEMSERFKAIIMLANNVEATKALDLIVKIAEGKNLADLILDAGRTALGLPS